MTDEPKWVRTDVVYAIHNRQIAEHGGDPGVRDVGLIESALARPQHLWAYGDPKPDLAEMAAAYTFGLAKNHGFVDGNKRAAYVVGQTFLLINGLEINASQEEKYTTMIRVVTGEWSEQQLAQWYRQHQHSADAS